MIRYQHNLSLLNALPLIKQENNKYINFLIYIKMPTKEYYQKNEETLLKRQRGYYENNKEAIKERVRIKYHSLSPEEKIKKREYARNWYNNLSEEKKNIKREYGINRYHNMSDEA